jgi:hypothetical protein
MTDAYPALLQERITTYFSRSELADLCLRLGFNFDSLPEAGLDAQTRELIQALARQGRLPELLAALRAARSFVDWPDAPADYRPPPAAAGSGGAGTGGITINTLNATNAIVGPDGRMTITHGPTFSGDFRGALLNVQSTLRDTRQAIQALPAADDAARAELIRLIGQLETALKDTPPGREAEAEEVANVAKDLVEAAGAEKPSPTKVRGLGGWLKEAAGALVDVLPAVAEIAAHIATAVAALSS